ncbi:hypothetical protein [Salinimicrobium sp. GXAS 041]|uniref:hypothetical protein n=1 Tax=Salinimicrobium sp. GXAS 041 TaxID=3400806 RepID=UPI003C783D30
MKNILSQFTIPLDIKDPQFKKMIFGGLLVVISFAVFFGMAGYYAGKAFYYFTH